METSDSEPEVKRPKIYEYGEPELPVVEVETESSFANFSLGDYVFSSDEESISRRLAEDVDTRNEISETSSWSANDNDSRNNSSPNRADTSGDEGDKNSNNDDDADAKANSDSDLSTSSPVAEKRKSSWSEGTIDFETDKESSEDFVLSPFSTSPNIEIQEYTNSSIDSDRMYDVEFEVASVSENNDNPIEDANSSSGVDEPVNLDMPRYEVEDVDGDRDTDNFADAEIQLSDAESDPKRKTSRLNTSDSELSEKDKWFCNQCGARSQPYLRYCLRCFRIRRNWLPKRTKPRRAKRKKVAKGGNRGTEAESEPVPSTSRDSSANLVKTDGRSDTPKPPASDDSSSERMMESFLKNLVSVPPEDNDTDTVDGPIKRRETVVRALNNTGILTPPSSNPHSHQEIDSQSCSSSNKPSLNAIEPPESPLSPPLSQQSLLPRNNQYPSSSQAALNGKNGINSKFLQSLKSAIEDPVKIEMSIPVSNKDETHSNVPMCNLCCVREKDAAFVHNKIAHHFCCFVCADKILKKNGKCPICRDRVFRVVKIISV